MRYIKYFNERFEELILILLLVILACTMMVQVIMRYIFNSSLSGAEELCRYCFIWMAFLSISYSILKESMLRIDILLKKLPIKLQRIFDILCYVSILVFFMYLFFNSIGVVKAIKISGQLSPANGIPMYMIYVASTIGFLLAIIRSIQKLVYYIGKSTNTIN